MRTVASGEPPGGNVTIMRIGLFGQPLGALAGCAATPMAAAISSVAVANRRNRNDDIGDPAQRKAGAIAPASGVSVKSSTRHHWQVKLAALSMLPLPL
jgi:hypothetical protein